MNNIQRRSRLMSVFGSPKYGKTVLSPPPAPSPYPVTPYPVTMDMCVFCGFEIAHTPAFGWAHDFPDAFDHPPAPMLIIEEEP